MCATIIHVYYVHQTCTLCSVNIATMLVSRVKTMIVMKFCFVSPFSGNMVVVVPHGAAPGIIMLRNAQWAGMHLAIAKGGNFSIVSYSQLWFCLDSSVERSSRLGGGG